MTFDLTKFDKMVKQIWSVPIVSIYPPKCGVCGKIDKNSLCNKCQLEFQKLKKMKILNNYDANNDNDEDIKDMYFDELMYIFNYDGLIRKLILDYKFNEKSYLYLTFVNFLTKNEKIFENIKKYDTIIPVPISKKRLKNRGYNQSFLIAKEIAKKSNLEIMNNCLIKTKNIIEQSKLNKEERIKNIQGVYEFKNEKIKKSLENKKF